MALLALMVPAFSLAIANGADDARGLVLFKNTIQPLLQEHCYACHSHGTGTAKGGLVLDSWGGWQAGADSGPVIIPGKPDDSRLVQVIEGRQAEHNSRVTLNLAREQIDGVREWISLGARDPRVVPAPDSSNKTNPAAPHWSFVSVRRPAIPRLANSLTARCANPIDVFVAATLAEKSSAIRLEADRRTLIRRVYFDLLGLPPSPEEVGSFVADPDPRAYEKLVDRLLESPHYGERWGRHWLDVAGFAESSMFIGDGPRQGFWHYRDYVIRAFNEDKPYDRFVLEQVAGDELFNWRDAGNFTAEQVNLLAATGFLRCTPDATDNQPITEMDKRFAAQQAAVEVSMKALMGLTINCVRCHDHKFDPIKQEEYYRLMAVFQPAYDPEKWLPGIWTDAWIGSLRVIPLAPRDQRQWLMRESRGWFEEHLKLGKQEKSLETTYRDRWLTEHRDQWEKSADQGAIAKSLDTPPDDRGDADQQRLADAAARFEITAAKLREHYPDYAKSYGGITNQLATLKKGNENFRDKVIWDLFDVSTNPTPAHLLKRGNYETPGPEVHPGVIAAIDAPDRTARFDQSPGDWTTGRRLALARWLTHPGHPLLARVMVNRIWQYHFGVGIVATPDDFGARGARPVSQELLDWLAAEFVENEWSIKHIHRLILNSATYRQQTVASDQISRPSSSSLTIAVDAVPEKSAPIAAFNPGPQRLEAGEIRDAMLAMGGRLDMRLFGPSVPTERRGDGSFDIQHGHPDRLRRTIYIHTRRTYVPTFLTLFDEPQMDTNWSKRSTSAIAQQALALMNEPFVVECASVFAARVVREGGDTFEGRLRRAFELAYQRAPEAEEVETFRHATVGVDRPWPVICQALLGSSEFLYVD